MQRCPFCRARLADAATCPRCGADLTLPQASRASAARRLDQALACLAEGERRQAKAHIDQALWYHRTPFAETLAEWLRAPSPEPHWQPQPQRASGANAPRWILRIARFLRGYNTNN